MSKWVDDLWSSLLSTPAAPCVCLASAALQCLSCHTSLGRIAVPAPVLLVAVGVFRGQQKVTCVKPAEQKMQSVAVEVLWVRRVAGGPTLPLSMV